MNDALVHYGGEVKALGGGRVSGYLVVFGTAEQPDLSIQRDYFTRSTDLDIEDGDRKSVYYAHGLDPQLKTKRIGSATVKTDDVGVWIEAQLSLRDEYEKAVYGLVEAGKMGWSSGAPSHLVTRKAVEAKSGESVHEILSWNLSEASLTPTPAEPRADAFALKSLPALVNLTPAGEDDTTKTLPSGFTYRDHIRFLESELNEDFGRQGSCDPWDSYSPSIYYWVENLKENPDTVIYHRSDAPGDTFGRPYTVANNDAVWGDEQEVIETTTYVDAPNDDAVPMAGKQADVTALKAMLTSSMTFSDHADIATSAMEGFVARAGSLTDMSIKAGRVISSANRDKMKKIHAGMQVAHDAMAEHMGKMGQMLTETDPDAKKDVEELEAMRTRYVRLQSELLHLSG